MTTPQVLKLLLNKFKASPLCWLVQEAARGPWWPQRCGGGGCGERGAGGTGQTFEFFGPQAAASPGDSLEKQILRSPPESDWLDPKLGGEAREPDPQGSQGILGPRKPERLQPVGALWTAGRTAGLTTSLGSCAPSRLGNRL